MINRLAKRRQDKTRQDKKRRVKRTEDKGEKILQVTRERVGFYDRLRVKSCMKRIKIIRFLGGGGGTNMMVKRGKKVKHFG